MNASLTWRLRQRGQWLTAATTMPAESAARVACTILREFGGRRFTPADVSIIGEVRKFNYRGEEISVSLRRLEK